MGQSHDFENILMKNPNRSHRGLNYAFFPENQIPNRGIGIILLQIFGQFIDKPSHSDTCIHSSTNTQACRKRGGRGHVPPVLGRSVNPISSRGGAQCVQMDFTRTFEANAECNNIYHV